MPAILLCIGLFLFLFSPPVAARAQENTKILEIGLFRNQVPSSVLITPGIGAYDLIADGNKIADIDKSEGLKLTVENEGISARLLSRTLGTFQKIELKKKKWGNSLRIKPLSPSLSEREYPDNLIVTRSGHLLNLFNRVYIEYYIAGVVEAESGIEQNMEFYKVQAIICRTYALANLRRHEEDGFHLCDQVHCQVYKGKNRFNSMIKKAAIETSGLVLVDSDIRLITASFHSNCGGQTVNSEDAWKYPVPYLRSIQDTFCLDMPHASWERAIERDKWLGYLERKYRYPVSDTLSRELALNFCYPERETYFSPLDSTILLKDLRSDWKLNSTFFSVEAADTASVLLKGSGFGHGVGLCQEGAMRMSQCGYAYSDILHFYYTNVHLIDLHYLDFFRAE